VASLGLYILLDSNQKFDSYFTKEQQKIISQDVISQPIANASKPITGKIAWYQDVIPQPIVNASKPITGKIAWYFEGTIPSLFKSEFDAGVVDETYFPYYKSGEIYPPKKYDVESNYSEQDIEKMKRALEIAYRYTDINKALEDGYLIRRTDVFDNGMGNHVVNVDYILDGEINMEKPDFLNYIKNYKTGRLQLAQLGFLDQRTTPPELFDAKEAQGHFHVGNFCYLIESNIYYTNPAEALKDRNGNFINPSIGENSDIFSIIEDAEFEIPNKRCDQEGGRSVSPIWMMHFAVNMYNDFGMFSDSFTYIDYLSSEGITHSFYGKEVIF